MLRLAKRIFIFLSVAYVIFCGVLYVFQDELLFHPFPLDATVRLDGEEVHIPVAEGIDLSAVWLRAPGNRRALVFFHGNTGNLRRCTYQARQTLTGHGYDVLVVDYRGFGKSPGKLRYEDDLLLDAERVYDFVRAGYAEADIAVVGYSMGSGPATHLASVRSPTALILVAPYRSIPRIAFDYGLFIPSFLVKYPLRNEDKLPLATCPVTIAHGTADAVIPYEHGAYLGALPGVDFRGLPGVSHRRIILSGALRQIVGQVLQN